MRRLIVAGALAASLAASPSCRHFLPSMPEPLRIENADDISPERMGFARGKTTFSEAESLMKGRRLTGIAKTMYTDIDARRGDVLQAISADYQTRVHVFENDRFLESVNLNCGGVLPFGMALRIAKSGPRLFLMALYRDPLEMTDQAARSEAPRIEFFEREKGAFRYSRALRLSGVNARHGGMSRPIFVGHSLDDGVFFIARDREGGIWDGGYYVKMENDRLGMTYVPLAKASGCSCIQRYMYGGDPETLWRE
ncbi:MAG TPA: hypothetical protein VLD37_06085 [Candidatus Bilamarchaeum sp.]|nr:hypothetical protein [Candidatus Bilamarchaeum sp.]